MFSSWSRRSQLTLLVLTALALGWFGGSAESRADEYRAVWVDVWHSGFKSTSQINSLISRANTGRYNAIFAEVLAYHDTATWDNGHGAFWKSSVVPWASVVEEEEEGFDPLGYLVQQAHASGIEVHTWLIPFRACSSWPPSGNTTLSEHPEWTMTERDNIGTLSKIGGDEGVYKLDASSPDVQEYLVSIAKELVTNYDIDGVHWDYIRYEQSDAGYPSDLSYEKSGYQRFRNITGYSDPDPPPTTGHTEWNDFRRRGITELVRRCRFEIAAIDSTAIQSAALVTWGNAPGDFHDSDAYARFQDWEYWMDMGYLDLGCPMAYYDERDYPTWYRGWVNSSQTWKHERFICIGQANYMNSKANSVTQMLYARTKNSEGMCNFSYYATADEDNNGWENDWTWYSYVASNLYTSAADPPDMPWRDPGSATEGTVYGRVTIGPDYEPVDNAEVTIDGGSNVRTDGNGYYIATMIAPGPVDVRAVADGGVCVNPVQLDDVNAVAGDVVEANLQFLVGDTDGNHVVDYVDLIETRNHIGAHPLSAKEYDADCNSSIDIVDVVMVRNRLGDGTK